MPHTMLGKAISIWTCGNAIKNTVGTTANPLWWTDRADRHVLAGNHVRYGPNRVIFNTAEALRDIYGVGSVSKVMKASAYEPLVHRAPNTLTIKGGKEHARRRRIMAQGVSDKAQRGYEHRIATHIDTFCDVMFGNQNKPETEGSARRWSEPMDMSNWCKSPQL